MRPIWWRWMVIDETLHGRRIIWGYLSRRKARGVARDLRLEMIGLGLKPNVWVEPR